MAVAVCVQRLPSLSRETVDVERRYRELKVRRVQRRPLATRDLRCLRHSAIPSVCVCVCVCVVQEQVRVERSKLSDFELEEREVARLKKERERRAMEEEVLQEVSPYNCTPIMPTIARFFQQLCCLQFMLACRYKSLISVEAIVGIMFGY